MKVILLDNVKKIGKKYEKVDVSTGYANNFLIPNKKAIPATPTAEKELAQKMNVVAQTQEETKQAVHQGLDMLAGKPVVVTAKANDEGSLYAKITAGTLAEYLSKTADAPITADYIALDESITNVGEHNVSVTAFDKTVNVVVVVENEG